MIVITSYHYDYAKTVHIACTIIKVRIIVIVLLMHLTIRRLALSRAALGRSLFNMFNPGDHIVNVAHQLIKFLIDVGVLVIKKPRKLILKHTLVEVPRGLHFP
jgi:hypothetical protein